ncbi:MAG TPA: hypothetical protein VFW05_09760 [Verrucomicrobiae bacterium]|jgi:hypothetical protein|nr:hypothetical protein [Verrucomicrobiae bacterium]
MNEPENTIQDSSEAAGLRREVADLRRQANTLYIALALLSLTLAAFIGLQVRRAGKDIDAIRPQASQLVDVNKKDTPLIQSFVSQLTAYGQGHPDYADKVLSRFGIKPGAQTNPATGTPATAPKK